MMRLLSVFLAVWIAVQCLGYLPALAAVQVTSGQTADGLKGEAQLNKVGALLFSEGIAEMTGNTIQIKGKQKGEGKSGNLLSGTIFRVTKVDGRVTAHVFFNDGPALAVLTALNCDERVELKDGSTVPGPIQQISPTEVIAGGRTIAMDVVNKIHSNRCFIVHTLEGEAARLHLEPTCTMVSGGTVKHHKIFTVRNVVIVTAVAAVITLAIVLPITLSHHGGHHGDDNSTAQAYYLLTTKTPPPSQPPPPPEGHPKQPPSPGLFDFFR